MTGVPPEERAAGAPVPPAAGSLRSDRRTRHALVVTATVAALAAVLFVAGGLLVGRPSAHSGAYGGRPAATPPAALAGARAAPPVAGIPPPAGRSLQAEIEAAQAHLRSRPGDRAGWGRLGTAYVEQARITGDPSYYAKAEEALRRATQAGGTGDPAVLAGLGALANAQHRFADARAWATKALAVNPRLPAAHAVLVDALTQLGEYPAATAAAQRMLDLRPDVASYARASYELELHGDTNGAREALERALGVAGSPADIAFCRQYLGQLALNTGRPQEALRQYAQGLAVDPASAALLAGKARAEAAAGQLPAALRDYATATARAPVPQHLLEYAELAEAAGKPDEARRQYDLVLTQQRLLEAGGVADNLFRAHYEADHGSAAAALRHARAEWNRRHSAEVADALAWALHRAGEHGEALRHAVTAARLGWRNALFGYHRGMIEKALGRRDAARRSLAAALATDPNFSPLHAPRARQALAELDRAR